MNKTEIAFKANKDALFYRNYFRSKAEKEKFRDLGLAFVEKHFQTVTQFRRSDILSCSLSANEAEKFKPQLRVHKTPDGMYTFKKMSGINKLWKEEVYDKIEKVDLVLMDHWTLGCFRFHARFSLWDFDGNVYGYIEGDDVSMPEGCSEIKVSEYYSVIELAENAEYAQLSR